MGIAKRWYQNVVVMGSSVLLVPGAAYFGIAAHRAGNRLDACLDHIQQHPDANREKQGSVRPDDSGASDENKDPADAGKDVGATHHDRAEVSDQCVGLARGAGDAIARASYELSLLGYYATLFFGAIGVIGIFLGFSTARDARDDARRQVADAAAAGVVVPGAPVRNDAVPLPILILGLMCMGLCRIRARWLGRR